MSKPRTVREAVKSAGQIISAQELRNIQSQFGQNAVNKAVEIVRETPNTGLGDSARSFYQSIKSVEPLPVQNPNPQGFYSAGSQIGKYNISPGFYSEPEYAFLTASALTQLNGDIEKEIEQIRGLSAGNVASIQGSYALQAAEASAGASRYASDRDLEARKYIADQDFTKAVRVTELEGKNRLDLQAIVNTGLKEIEGIRGQTQKDVQTIEGEFGLKQETERQRGQKEIARIGADSSFRNALIGAFNF